MKPTPTSNVINGLAIVCTIALAGLTWVLAQANRVPAPFTDTAPIANARTDGRPQDIVLITIDTLRADRLGMYGHQKARTPNLDALAARGIRFDNATVPFPRTTPSMASLFTGLWPHHHGSREVWEPIKDGKLLTEVLSDAGFATFGITSNAACAKNQHFDRGFDGFLNARDPSRKDHFRSIDDAEQVTDGAIGFIEQADPNKPLFLWAHYVDPHWRYAPPKSFKPQPRARKCRSLDRSKSVDFGQVLSNHNGIAERALADCRKLYDAEIAYADREVGRLIEALKASGRYENALLVFTSDHGENMGEDGYWFGHGPSVHDAALRVPLVMAGPSLPEGHVETTLARTEDIMPTILAILDLPADLRPEMDGSSFAWLWDSSQPMPERAIEAAFSESGTPLRARTGHFLVVGKQSNYCINHGDFALCRSRDPRSGEVGQSFFNRQDDPLLKTPLAEVPSDIEQALLGGIERWKPETARQRSVRTKTHKLVHFPNINGEYDRRLFDLRTDPGETTDISAQEPDLLEELDTLLLRWLADVPLYESRERSQEEIDELRSLGYIH